MECWSSLGLKLWYRCFDKQVFVWLFACMHVGQSTACLHHSNQSICSSADGRWAFQTTVRLRVIREEFYQLPLIDTRVVALRLNTQENNQSILRWYLAPCNFWIVFQVAGSMKSGVVVFERIYQARKTIVVARFLNASSLGVYNYVVLNNRVCKMFLVCCLQLREPVFFLAAGHHMTSYLVSQCSPAQYILNIVVSTVSLCQAQYDPYVLNVPWNKLLHVVIAFHAWGMESIFMLL